VELISASAVEFHPGVTIGVTQVSRDAWGGLNQLGALLPEAERSYYLDGAPEENGFFRGVTTRSNEFMDRHSEAHAGIPRCSPRTPAVRVGEVIFDMYEICSHLSGGIVRAEQEFQLSRVRHRFAQHAAVGGRARVER